MWSKFLLRCLWLLLLSLYGSLLVVTICDLIHLMLGKRSAVLEAPDIRALKKGT